MEADLLLVNNQLGAIGDGDAATDELDQISVKYGSFSSLKFENLLDDIPKRIITEVPQGRHLGIFSTMVLFVSRMVGSGIFATPSSIFVNCGGNPLLFFGIWTLAALVAYSGLYVFLEFGSWLPRSGGRKNFLEQAFDKPYLMMSVTFACYCVITGYAMSNSIIFGEYILSVFNYSNPTVSKLLSMSIIIVIVTIHGTSVKNGVRIQNFLGGLKFILIFLMCLTGFYTLFFFKGKEESKYKLNWTGFQDPLSVSSSSIASAFINAFFCFSGWDSVHVVSSEIKNPTRTLKIAGPLSLLICFFCYIMMNVAYTKVLTYEEIKNAGPLVGSVLFRKLFGEYVGGKLISSAIVLSSTSNIFVVLYGISRLNQEVFREGYLPFSNKLAINWPNDAPLPSLLMCGFLTTIWLSILPSEGTSFDYLVNMEGYGNQFFLLLTTIGLLVNRHKREYEEPKIKCNILGVSAMIIVSIYLLIAPFVGEQSSNKVGFLPSYQVMSLLMISLCFCYWLIVFFLVPRIVGYTLLSKLETLDDGLIITKWTKKYID